MKKTVRSNQRGHADHGWLKTYHSFSFADFYNPQQMGFKSLRVINEDRIAGGTGFGTHPHRDMEIVTYVIAGALAHKDSLGTQSTISPGEVQYMSAGTGVFHSEFNAREDSETHLFQIWILPKSPGGNPQYDQKSFASTKPSTGMTLVVSGDGRAGSIKIRQDADIWIGRFSDAKAFDFSVQPGRGVYLHVVRGSVEVAAESLQSGDAFMTDEPSQLKIRGITASTEVLLFDLV